MVVRMAREFRSASLLGNRAVLPCSSSRPERKASSAKSCHQAGRGIALHGSSNTIVAMAADVAVARDGVLKVDHVVAAVDSGITSTLTSCVQSPRLPPVKIVHNYIPTSNADLSAASSSSFLES